MGKRRTEDDEDSSSMSEHLPAALDRTQASQSEDGDGIDPEQDALVGETPLDDRFNEEQLWRLHLKKDEYWCGGKKQRKEIAQKTGEVFASEMLAAGVNMTEKKEPPSWRYALDPISRSRNISRSLPIQQNVRKWYAQCVRSRREPFEWNVHWSARLVFYKENKATVRNTQKAMYEAHTGKVAKVEDLEMGDFEDLADIPDLPVGLNSKPFHFFQKALTTEWDALPRNEKDVYEEKVTLWRSLGPDEEE
ncbi:hypothetical protein NMY22_g13685 [Coprinellus aureogranulatus]|nr:hypothetical protein NMY22_g13685 [Coprinellus aureogranulatus]